MINVGNKLQHQSPAPIVGRNVKFIDMRIDSGSMGNVITTDVPLVADVALRPGRPDRRRRGPDDAGAQAEGGGARAGSAALQPSRRARMRALVTKNPDWNRSPMIADRLTWEIAQFADKDAIVVHEAGSVNLHSFGFNPLGGRELFFYYGAHLGSGVGTAAGVKLARPNQQVICLVGDGSFVFGPTALWNMARLELPVITVVYNNHAYSGPHSRVIEKTRRRAHGADRPVLSRLSRQPRHEHGAHRQRLRRGR